MTWAASQLLLGDSPPMREARALIERFGPTRLSVLVEGPTGSGKELAAQALHAASGRPGKLVAFNVCAIPDAMFEDALFGHVRGAFTGAASDHGGYLREADGGTVFLDEVGALAPHCQVKLLRAIETRQFRPVGGRTDCTSDFRLISASNTDLSSLIEAGVFRADLAHRLAAAVVRLPPLRERMEDLRVLVAGIVEQLDPSGALSVAASALRPLRAHEWPGNVRELRSVIERSAALASGRVIGHNDVQRALQNGSAPRASVARRGGFTQRRLLDVLNQTEWNFAEAARVLQVHRATIYRRLRRLDMDPSRSGQASDGFRRAAGSSA